MDIQLNVTRTRITLVGWFSIVDVAPLISVWRLPLVWRKKWVILATYGVLMFWVFGISSYAYSMKYHAQGNPKRPVVVILLQFFQPILWMK